MEVSAFYLPQFHPIAENDRWWGKGFTEWRNVATARPRFAGHKQPVLPERLGFYDLRLPSVVQDQYRLAQEFGINSFCVYHYWFSGKRLLETPVNNILADPDLEVRFSLCWANEPWTRTWDGLVEANHLLVPQTYSLSDHRQHALSLARGPFSDPRYVRIDGRPLFVVYKPTDIPDFSRSVAVWRETVGEELGQDLFLVGVEKDSPLPDDVSNQFDSTLRFTPNRRDLGRPLGSSLGSRLIRKLTGGRLLARHRDTIYRYPDLASNVIKRIQRPKLDSRDQWETVAPGWDNSPRRAEGARILIESETELFTDWVAAAAMAAQDQEHPALFVNAWNEWAEGAYLEPDLDSGLAVLEAFAAGLRRSTVPTRVL